MLEVTDEWVLYVTGEHVGQVTDEYIGQAAGELVGRLTDEHIGRVESVVKILAELLANILVKARMDIHTKTCLTFI